ncbi:hypothetical protein ACL7TT_12600 [Microbulbifer sp. 2304DJ12-6]|uniref:hypothetical protein n=1 Tax=Microbulbifer sp. 2304DJ12-6 TaxID=3233340 RepID=UPI0039B0BC72
MKGLQIIVTHADRQALIIGDNTGTQPVWISVIGITAQGFTPQAAQTDLTGEIKCLTTFAGSAEAAAQVENRASAISKRNSTSFPWMCGLPKCTKPSRRRDSGNLVVNRRRGKERGCGYSVCFCKLTVKC